MKTNGRGLPITLLVFALGALLTVPALGAPEKGKRCSDGVDNDGDGLIDAADPDCGGDGGGDGGGGGKCQIDFAATFADAPTDGVRGDGKGPYPAFTGSGPGFKLDTNGKPQLEKPNDDRKLILDFGANQDCSAAGWPLDFCSELKGVALVFDQTGDGLDLCALAAGGDVGTVPLHIAFLDDAGDRKTLTYGCLAEGGGATTGNSVEAMVSRVSDSTWQIAGETACLRDGGIFGTILDGTDETPLQMPFLLTIVDTSAP